MLKHFRISILFTLACLALGTWYGWSESGSLAGALKVLWIVTVLAVLEVSLSFDNAVVNASVLEGMDELWRKRFLTWGMIFAVYGMYVFFPLAIVAVAAGIGPIEAFNLSLSHPAQYETIMHEAHPGIAGFGGAFLLLVGLKFFFDSDKEVHWIHVVEEQLTRLGVVPMVETVVVLLTMWLVGTYLPPEQKWTYLIAGILGIATFLAVHALGKALELREERLKAAGAMVRSGLGAFLYLNVLDATFSFDGVIGAFALSNNMIVIALGLSIGAMFVRSLTLLMVQQGTLSEYRFLEHGAFWAIIALGVIMLVSARWEVPDAVTGLIGAVLIVASVGWSIRHRRKFPEHY
jgi:hypothetical protein